MVQTIFYLPGYLKNNQKRLEELAAKYNLDLDKEIAEAEKEINEEENKNQTSAVEEAVATLEKEDKKDK